MSDMMKDKLAAVEKQMAAKLEEIRISFNHPGMKGTAVEDSFRAFLREYLPKSLEVGYGEIIDTHEQSYHPIDTEGRSAQTDIVITEEHPFTFTRDLPGLFFVEGVRSIGEVKTVLNSRELETSLNNAYTLKRLKPVPIEWLSYHSSSIPMHWREFIPCFLVAFESGITLSKIQENIERFEREHSLEHNQSLDAVFVLNRGWVINLGDGDGYYRMIRDSDGSIVKGWIFQESDNVLFQLLGWLSAVIWRRIILGPPIIINYLDFKFS